MFGSGGLATTAAPSAGASIARPVRFAVAKSPRGVEDAAPYGRFSGLAHLIMPVTVFSSFVGAGFIRPGVSAVARGSTGGKNPAPTHDILPRCHFAALATVSPAQKRTPRRKPGGYGIRPYRLTIFQGKLSSAASSMALLLSACHPSP